MSLIALRMLTLDCAKCGRRDATTGKTKTLDNQLHHFTWR